jgi:pimeloyl-ACP methyl ester carboxylesterase
MHYFEADGVRVHAADWEPGSGTSSRRVLLVHGLGANTLSWQPVGQPLADRLDATVTAIDLVGFGRTRAPERAATIERNRDLVLSVLDQLGPSTILGNSMGGVIGAGVTARRPDLVDALVMVNPALPWGRINRTNWARAARFAPVMWRSVGHRIVSARAQMLGPERLVDLSLGVTLHEPDKLDPALRRRLVLLAAERYAYPEAPAAYADAARTLLQELTGAFDTDLATAAAARPTLLLHGEEDRLVSVEFAHAAAARHASVELVLLDGVGHAPQLEDPERFVDVVAGWLERSLPAEAGGAAPPGSDGAADGRMDPHVGGSDSRSTWAREPRGAGQAMTRGRAPASSPSPSAPSSPS